MVEGERLTMRVFSGVKVCSFACTIERATIRNVNVLPGAPDRAGFAYGVQFVELDPLHFTLLQNLTYEALLADRQKIM